MARHLTFLEHAELNEDTVAFPASMYLRRIAIRQYPEVSVGLYRDQTTALLIALPDTYFKGKSK